MVMTREEVEEVVAQHMGQAVAQIGKDLADRYATKEEVAESIKNFANALNEAVQEETEKWKQEGLRLAKDLAEGRDIPKDNPLSFVTEVVDDVTTLQLRVMELGLLVVLGRKTGLIKRSLEKTIRFESLLHTLTDRQRREVLADIERYAAKSSRFKDVQQEIREFLEGGE